MPDARSAPRSYFDQVATKLSTMGLTHLVTHQVDTDERFRYFVNDLFSYCRLTTLVFVHQTKAVLVVLRYFEEVYKTSDKYTAYWNLGIPRVDLPGKATDAALRRIGNRVGKIPFVAFHNSGANGHGLGPRQAQAHLSISGWDALAQDSENDRLPASMIATDLQQVLHRLLPFTIDKLYQVVANGLAPTHEFPGCAQRFFEEFPLAMLQERVTRELRVLPEIISPWQIPSPKAAA